jgi:hypothetical protein
VIRKLPSGHYRLYSRAKDPKTGRHRHLGTFRTRAAAERCERVMQAYVREALTRRLAFERSRPWHENDASIRAATARPARADATATAPTRAGTSRRPRAAASAAIRTASRSVFALAAW